MEHAKSVHLFSEELLNQEFNSSSKNEEIDCPVLVETFQIVDISHEVSYYLFIYLLIYSYQSPVSPFPPV